MDILKTIVFDFEKLILINLNLKDILLCQR